MPVGPCKFLRLISWPFVRANVPTTLLRLLCTISETFWIPWSKAVSPKTVKHLIFVYFTIDEQQRTVGIVWSCNHVSLSNTALDSRSSSTPSFWLRRPSSRSSTTACARRPCGTRRSRSSLACWPSPTSSGSCTCITKTQRRTSTSWRSTGSRHGEVSRLAK